MMQPERQAWRTSLGGRGDCAGCQQPIAGDQVRIAVYVGAECVEVLHPECHAGPEQAVDARSLKTLRIGKPRRRRRRR
jgi:hypothetical protein